MNILFDIILIQDETLISFIVSMFFSILLGLAIAMVYRYTHRGMNYESSFLSTLVLLAPIVTLVMYLIQGDLVLSLGLVGSLSIIRFRTPIKDTRDMVFLFWSIAMGLGMGTLNWTLSVIATIILGILISIFYLVRYGRQIHTEYILIIAGQTRFDDAIMKPFYEGKNIDVQLRSTETKGDQFENVYELRFENDDLENVQALVEHIRKQSHVQRVSLLSPQLTLPM